MSLSKSHDQECHQPGSHSLEHNPGTSCCCLLLQVKLPFSIDAAKADTTVHSDGDRLQVRLPFRPYTDVLAEAKGLKEIAAC